MRQEISRLRSAPDRAQFSGYWCVVDAVAGHGDSLAIPH